MCEDYDYLGSRSDGGFAEYCLFLLNGISLSRTTGYNGRDVRHGRTMHVAQHAIRKGSVTAGKRVVIFGAGPIGIMAARWAKIFGAADVLLVDVVDEKVEFGKARGQNVVNSLKENVVAAVKALTDGRGADVVIEGTGTGAALGQAIECARTFGTVVLMGNPHKDTTIKLSQHSQILRKELTLQGIWNSHYSGLPINEWHFTMRMMDEGTVQVLDLISHRSGWTICQSSAGISTSGRSPSVRRSTAQTSNERGFHAVDSARTWRNAAKARCGRV